MKNILQLVSRLDAGGVLFKHRIYDDQTHFKTFFGGFISIFLYIASALYLFYMLYLWYDGQILPKVSQSQTLIDYEDLYFDTSPVEIKISAGTLPYNPFQEKNNVLTPYIMQYVGVKSSAPIPIFATEDQEFDGSWYNTKQVKGNIIYNNKDVNLVLNNVYNEKKSQTQILFMLVRCNQIFLSGGNVCASDKIIDEFISSTPVINFRLNLNQFDAVSMQTNALPKETYFLPNKGNPLYVQAVLRQTQLTIDDGLLIKSYSNKDFTSSAEMITQQMNDVVSMDGVNIYPIFSGLVRLDTIRHLEQISYPKLGEIMADVGTIVQMIFMVKYLLEYYNSKLLQSQIVKSIFEAYETKKGDQKYSKLTCKNHTSQITDANKTLAAEYQKAIIKKLSIFNLYYEIARIQQELQNIKNINNENSTSLRKNNQIGKDLCIFKAEPANIDENARIISYKNQVYPIESVLQNEDKSISIQPPDKQPPGLKLIKKYIRPD